MRQIGLLRKNVLVPGEILERFGEKNCPGKYHGSVVKVDKTGNDGLATIQMTDIKKRICLPLSDVHQYVLTPEKLPLSRPKRPRDDLEYSEWKRPVAPPSMPVSGCELENFIGRINQECHDLAMKPGTRVWINLGTSNGKWPAIIWALQYCRKEDLPDVLLTYKRGNYLVCFYGEHSLMWVRSKQINLATSELDSSFIQTLENWGKKHKKSSLVRLATMETLSIENDNEMEINRVISLYNMHSMANRRYKNTCDICLGPGAALQCKGCDRRCHTLCLSPPVLAITHLPNKKWNCSFCNTSHSLEDHEGLVEENAAEHGDKMGLTPDWIVSAAAFDVFGLQKPTVSKPFIQKLLDPCTNSKIAPNIPAEKLYDKADNGLKLTNLWRGYYIILNPDFSSQVQWRFVNRAIDEVENESVPAVLLICRNSTDTAFYQRLRPYPRVNLKRLSILFKDYSNTPIGFGISLFCLAKAQRKVLYPKFLSVFEAHGEPSIPIDRMFVNKTEFWKLLDRLGDFTGSHHRDHWVKCSKCSKWRIVSWEAMKNLSKLTVRWDCSLLDPPNSSCSTPLTKMESVGGHYVIKDGDDEYDPEFRTFDTQQEDVCSPNIVSVTEKKAAIARLDKIVSQMTSKDADLLPRERVMEQGNVDLRSLTALELARKARMAANKAYLTELGTKLEVCDTQGDHGDIVIEAAKGLAGHIAKTICFAEIEKAQLEYQRTTLLLSEEEARLKDRLEKIQSTKSRAKGNLEAALQAASIIEKELNR